MSAALLVRRAANAGVTLRIDDSGTLKAAGTSETLREWSPLLRENKAELLQFLQDAHDSTAQLVEAAMRCCDHWQDSPAAREQMRQDVIGTPPHLRADLLQHLTSAYPKE
jgi:hypothetical protein